ncbi:MAG: O-antigen ligase family protein [bacterium]|nr:O-antigen ligase family protein [bacterium]
MRIFSYLLIFLAALNTLSTSKFLLIFKVLVIWVTILSIYGLIEYFLERVPAVDSVFAYHNNFACYLLLSVPLAISLGKEKKFFFWLGGFNFLVLLLTGARSSWLAFLLSFLIFIPLVIKYLKWKWLIISLLVLVLSLGLLFTYDQTFRNSGLASRTKSLLSPYKVSSVQARFKYWQSGFKIIKGSFPFGTGIQTFYQIYPKYKHSSFKSCTHHFAHNDYLQLLSEAGILGLGAFIYLIFFYLYLLFNIIFKKRGKEPVFIGIGMGSVCFFLHSFLEFNIYIPALMVVLYLYFAFVGKESSLGVKTLEISASSKKFLYPSLGIVFLLLVWVSSLPYQGQIYNEKGLIQSKKGDFLTALESFKKAGRLSSLNSNVWTNLGKTYFKLEDAESAKSAFHKAIKSNPYEAINYELLADILYKSGSANDKIRAVNYLERAKKLNPSQDRLGFKLGILYKDLGLDKEAAHKLLEKLERREDNI